ncbi:MAG: DUF3040 domain-containing protein [Acidimicrobiia bacterium]
MLVPPNCKARGQARRARTYPAAISLCSPGTVDGARRRGISGSGVGVDDDQVNNIIADLERVLRVDDPRLARRVSRIELASGIRSGLVVGALVAASVLLSAGIATLSATVWVAGVVAFLAAFALAPRRPPQPKVARAHGVRRVDSWDEVVFVAGAWSSVAEELRASGGLDRWCPTLRPVSRTGLFAVGHRRPVRVLIRRRWFAEGLRWRADTGGAVLVGHVNMRPTMTATQQVQIWVHAEAFRCRRSRRALRVIHRETRTALSCWAATRGMS